jgi:hypothetical protein
MKIQGWEAGDRQLARTQTQVLRESLLQLKEWLVGEGCN